MKYLALLLLLLPQSALAGTALATRTLPAGTVISADDVTFASDQDGALQDVSQVVGQQLRVMVYQGRRIDLSFLSAPALIGRNQIVTIAYQKSALRIEAEGRALSAGSVGQIIRVMNNASRVTVAGRVAPDGTVIVAQN